MWNELSAAIVTLVKTSNQVDPTQVYDYAKSNMDHYPTITVTGGGNSEAAFSDTVRNTRNYSFNIDVYQERTEFGEDKAEEVLRNVVDSLITIFDANVHLNDTLLGRGYAKPINGDWGYTGEQLNTRSARIIISCEVIQ